MALTVAQGKDVYNYVETRFIASLEADDWLKSGGTGGVNTITKRVFRDGSPNLHSAQYPALTVWCRGAGGNAALNGTFGEHTLSVSIDIEYTNQYADAVAGITKCESVAGQLTSWLYAQNHSGKIDGLLTAADAIANRYDVDVNDFDMESAFIVRAIMTMTLDLRVVST